MLWSDICKIINLKKIPASNREILHEEEASPVSQLIKSQRSCSRAVLYII